MMIANSKFSILIATKNRVADLAVTLQNLVPLIERSDVKCIICDDGSTDGTSEYIASNYPQIHLLRNDVSKGYLNARNTLLEISDCDFAISLDDDAHILTQQPLENMEAVFDQNPDCGLIAFRIFWGTTTPEKFESTDSILQVQGFVGCGHAWRMQAWKTIPQYPEWFKFYGEEDFAAFQLFKKNWKVLYVPTILVQHRVDQKTRRKNADYHVRLARSLTSGWSLYFLFVPVKLIPRKFLSSIWSQLSRKVFKGDIGALKALLTALFNLLKASALIYRNSNRLSDSEYKTFRSLPSTKIYWTPSSKKM